MLRGRLISLEGVFGKTTQAHLLANFDTSLIVIPEPDRILSCKEMFNLIDPLLEQGRNVLFINYIRCVPELRSRTSKEKISALWPIPDIVIYLAASAHVPVGMDGRIAKMVRGCDCKRVIEINAGQDRMEIHRQIVSALHDS